MTPFSFEWKWISDYFIFMGLLYLALAIIGAGLTYTFFKTWMDLSKADTEHGQEGIPYRSRYSEY